MALIILASTMVVIGIVALLFRSAMQVIINITTDRTHYTLGEPVTVTVVLKTKKLLHVQSFTLELSCKAVAVTGEKKLYSFIQMVEAPTIISMQDTIRETLELRIPTAEELGLDNLATLHDAAARPEWEITVLVQSDGRNYGRDIDVKVGVSTFALPS